MGNPEKSRVGEGDAPDHGERVVVKMILAFCGIDCTECPCYIATRDDDEEELSEIAKVWASSDDAYEAEDLVCDGCYGPRVSKDCAACRIKKCAVSRKIASCAHCENYSCEQLEKDWSSWKVHSGVKAKSRLDELHNRPARANF